MPEMPQDQRPAQRPDPAAPKPPPERPGAKPSPTEPPPWRGTPGLTGPADGADPAAASDD